MEGILRFKKGSTLKLKSNVNIKTFEDEKKKKKTFSLCKNQQHPKKHQVLSFNSNCTLLVS